MCDIYGNFVDLMGKLFDALTANFKDTEICLSSPILKQFANMRA